MSTTPPDREHLLQTIAPLCEDVAPDILHDFLSRMDPEYFRRFDPSTIANRATEADPAARPKGIDRVMVNGRWVVVDGIAVGERPGLML